MKETQTGVVFTEEGNFRKYFPYKSAKGRQRNRKFFKKYVNRARRRSNKGICLGKEPKICVGDTYFYY